MQMFVNGLRVRFGGQIFASGLKVHCGGEIDVKWDVES